MDFFHTRSWLSLDCGTDLSNQQLSWQSHHQLFLETEPRDLFWEWRWILTSHTLQIYNLDVIEVELLQHNRGGWWQMDPDLGQPEKFHHSAQKPKKSIQLFLWVPGIKLKSSGLRSQRLSLRSHLLGMIPKRSPLLTVSNWHDIIFTLTLYLSDNKYWGLLPRLLFLEYWDIHG